MRRAIAVAGVAHKQQRRLLSSPFRQYRRAMGLASAALCARRRRVKSLAAIMWREASCAAVARRRRAAAAAARTRRRVDDDDGRRRAPPPPPPARRPRTAYLGSRGLRSTSVVATQIRSETPLSDQSRRGRPQADNYSIRQYWLVVHCKPASRHAILDQRFDRSENSDLKLQNCMQQPLQGCR
jgi:hypothetical protein